MKGDTVWFNMQVGQDVQITRASLTIYKDGEVYASYFHRSESPFFSMRRISVSCRIMEGIHIAGRTHPLGIRTESFMAA